MVLGSVESPTLAVTGLAAGRLEADLLLLVAGEAGLRNLDRCAVTALRGRLGLVAIDTAALAGVLLVREVDLQAPGPWDQGHAWIVTGLAVRQHGADLALLVAVEAMLGTALQSTVSAATGTLRVAGLTGLLPVGLMR